MPTVRENIQSIIQKHIKAAVDEAIDVYRRSLEVTALSGPARGRRAAAAPTGGGRKQPRATKGGRRRARRSSAQITAAMDRVVGFIDKHPGLTSEQIVKDMGGDRKTISDALGRLRAEKKVKTSGIKRRMTYSL